jgi:uncharacterized membrane protein YeaQ/YmgE (transglycosylase-associated protein family)
MFELLWFGGIFAAVAAAMIVNWRREKTPLRTVVAGLVPGAAVLAGPALMRRLGFDPAADPVAAAILFALLGAVLLYLVWRLVGSWNDEERLAERTGPRDGYIVRAPLVPPRTRALLGVAIFALLIAFFAYFHFFVFLPE